MTKKISQLPVASTPDGSELLECVQGGSSKRTTASELAAASIPILADWDMSTDKFPSQSKRGKRYYGINGPTSSLIDRAGNRIPNSVFITSLIDNASDTSPLDWAIEYTITA